MNHNLILCGNAHCYVHMTELPTSMVTHGFRLIMMGWSSLSGLRIHMPNMCGLPDFLKFGWTWNTDMMIRVMPRGCVAEVYHDLFLFVYLNKLKRQCDSEILADLDWSSIFEFTRHGMSGSGVHDTPWAPRGNSNSSFAPSSVSMKSYPIQQYCKPTEKIAQTLAFERWSNWICTH